jgi:hypothetical protein
MTELDMQISALRTRRPSRSLLSSLRTLRPLDRRSIREPGERDAYWITVQQRLAESDAAHLMRNAGAKPPRP